MKSPSKTKETLEISLFTCQFVFFSLSSFTCNAQNASTQFFSISNFYFTSFCSSLIIYELHFGRFIFFLLFVLFVLPQFSIFHYLIVFFVVQVFLFFFFLFCKLNHKNSHFPLFKLGLLQQNLLFKIVLHGFSLEKLH